MKLTSDQRCAFCGFTHFRNKLKIFENPNGSNRTKIANLLLTVFIGRGTHADYWPQQSTDNKWQYMTTPLLPNVLPLPGREQDNQKRWVSGDGFNCLELFEKISFCF